MSQGSEGNAKEFLLRAGQTIRTGVETLVREGKELTRQGKIRLDIMSLENERNRKYEEIGKISHFLYKEGHEFPIEMGEVFVAFDGIESRIAERRAELDKLRVEADEGKANATQEAPEGAELAQVTEVAEVAEEKAYCAQCGAKTGPGDVYCSRCGAKLE